VLSLVDSFAIGLLLGFVFIILAFLFTRWRIMRRHRER
jgi:hypothetical protein